MVLIDYIFALIYLKIERYMDFVDIADYGKKIGGRNSDKLGADFRAYHNFKRSLDTLYLHSAVL